jgi:hypothetical protein
LTLCSLLDKVARLRGVSFLLQPTYGPHYKPNHFYLPNETASHPSNSLHSFVALFVCLFVCLFIQLGTAALRLIVRSGLDVPTFATRRLHACRHARAPSGGRWNCGQEMSGNFA